MADILNENFKKDLDKDIQTFLGYSQNNPPEIVISKPCRNSPRSSRLKYRQQSVDLPITHNHDVIPSLMRRGSEDSYISNNNVPVSAIPKLERLCSGESCNAWNTKCHSPLCSWSSFGSIDTNYYDDDDIDTDLSLNSSMTSIDEPKKGSMWMKLRKVIRWSPFMQSYKKQDYPWIQLAGHSGGFKAGQHGTILKKAGQKEVDCLKQLMNDVLRPYVPTFSRYIVEDEDSFIEMQDLLQDFEHPNYVMDCKMGIRTYLEEEVLKCGKPRKDLYQKMIAVDPSEPTDEENEMLSCTKQRYMQWREELSSTASLGFRIEGIKRGDNSPDKDFKKIKTEEDLTRVFQRFIDNREDLQQKYIQQLKAIKSALPSSKFFKSHEVIGSSLLFVHDASGSAGIWLIDFGKTVPLCNGTTITHCSEWVPGNHEDGYLIGLDNIINIWTNMDL